MSHQKNLPTLEEVDQFYVPEFMLERMVSKYKYSPEDGKNLVKEAKRMLYLSVKTSKDVSPSIKVDDGWHEMLMFTRYYQEFCEFIGQFIHHDPTPGPPDGGKMYEYTKKLYEETFGEKPDPRYWG